MVNEKENNIQISERYSKFQFRNRCHPLSNDYICLGLSEWIDTHWIDLNDTAWGQTYLVSSLLPVCSHIRQRISNFRHSVSHVLRRTDLFTQQRHLSSTLHCDSKKKQSNFTYGYAVLALWRLSVCYGWWPLVPNFQMKLTCSIRCACQLSVSMWAWAALTNHQLPAPDPHDHL